MNESSEVKDVGKDEGNVLAQTNESRRSAIILVVDDEVRNLRVIEAQLQAEGHTVLTATSGEAALAIVAGAIPDLILLDIMMPGMDGFEVAKVLKADERTKNVPIIVVTALDDRKSRLYALNIGAEEFITKPVDRAELWVRVRNLLRLKEYNNFLAHHAELLEAQVQARTRQLHDAYRDTIYTMVSAAEYKDEETGHHVQRISHYCRVLAEVLGMDGEFCDHIFYASPMHDIGKIAIPDAVLMKPGSFTPEEWTIMRTHAAFGAKILSKAASGSPYLTMGAEIAQNHHERWDGGGYPNGLKGEAIPLPARIMNICDQYDALRSLRPYKPAFSHAKTMAILTAGDGRTLPEHFDPAVLAGFGKVAGRFEEIFDSLSG